MRLHARFCLCPVQHGRRCLSVPRQHTRVAPASPLAEEQAASVLSQLEQRNVAAALLLSLADSLESDEEDAEAVAEAEPEDEAEQEDEKEEEHESDEEQ